MKFLNVLDSGCGLRSAVKNRFDRSSQKTSQLAAVCLFLALLSFPCRSESAFVDPLDATAIPQSSIEQRPLIGVTSAGENLVAVGSRGLIIFSEDQGLSWAQAEVPVQSDLLAVNFPSPDHGWAVGHDGVILHSTDRGKTWTRQSDGRLAGEDFTAFYTDMGPEGELALVEVNINYRDGATLPWLDVLFENDLVGYVTGSYGMIAGTTDGGKTWQPWVHRIDNPAALNLNRLRKINGNVYIAGERGQIYTLDRTRGFFIRTDTGYLGSFFGIEGIGNSLVAFGLRGTLYRSDDSGISWQAALDVPTAATLTAGIVLADKSALVLVDQIGQLLLVELTPGSVTLLPESANLSAAGITPAGDEAFIVTGLDGIKKIEVSLDAAATTH